MPSDHSHAEFHGEWMGENLYWIWNGKPTGFDPVDAWYNEIKDYDFETYSSKNGNKVGHFTQLIWKDSKEVGFGVAFNGSILMSVANYYPGGNFNMSQCYKEQIPKLISKEEKTSKELFNLESVKKNEIDAINYIRKYHQVSNLELDEQLCEKAAKHAENMGKTGSFSSYYDNGEWKNWTNWGILYLLRGANYKGAEGVRKWY
jgi:DNA-binding protein H-NS